jgi:DNA-binding LacI/PurR family transcriptional regulator
MKSVRVSNSIDNVCSKDALPASRQASIKDIARLAGVSHSTVSRALRSSPLTSEVTADRIRQIAQACGYAPSAAARSLVTRRTNIVGVVVTSIMDPFAAEVVGGIEDAAHEHGFSLLLADSKAIPDREISAVRLLEERRVDGIIITASRVGALYMQALTRMQAPIVLLNNQHPSEFVHSVMIANTEASLEMTRYLIGLGHQRIAYLGDRYGDQSDTERFAGYRQAINGAGVALDPEIVVHGDGKPEGGAAVMSALLALPHPPTAVFCYNDMTALGAIRTIRARGLRVPADVSVTGFDDLHIVQYTDPPLTTVRQPMPEMGRMAMETLYQLLRGVESQRNIKVPGEMIVRESTAPPA